MLFNSPEFILFFAAVFSLYALTMQHIRLQNAILLVASYFFYGWWDPRFLVLIAISTATDYLIGLAAGGSRLTRTDILKSVGFLSGLLVILGVIGTKNLDFITLLVIGFGVLVGAALYTIQKLPDDRQKKAYLVCSVVVNLSILGFFKYFNFFTESFTNAVSLFGWEPGFVTLNIILPVGISFYTFQTLSYTIDAYRGKLQPTRKFLELATFIAFFPQLVAGPIERASNLLPQFYKKRELNFDRALSGGSLFLWGLYKKLVIADNLAPIVDRAFSNPSEATSGELLVGALAFAFQIYGDFSGYSDMARGIARILGFDLMLNFNLPYFSRTPSEFWQRWHISLSSWLRDYLYIPLGGNRHGSFYTYRNLMLTMLLGGLWHGAAWTFIVWGLLHGGILVIYRILAIDEKLTQINLYSIQGFAIHIFAALVMQSFVLIAWVFFRAQSFTEAHGVLSGIFTNGSIANGPWGTLIFYIAPLLAVQILQRWCNETEILDRVHRFIAYNWALFVTFSIFVLSASSGQKFIYFDF